MRFISSNEEQLINEIFKDIKKIKDNYDHNGEITKIEKKINKYQRLKRQQEKEQLEETKQEDKERQRKVEIESERYNYPA